MYDADMANRDAQRLGRKGGNARAKKLTAEQKSAIAKAGAKALWGDKTEEERAEIKARLANARRAAHQRRKKSIS